MLYDIHGNLPALEAVLREVEEARVDLVVVGGDVTLGPQPRETLARLVGLEVPLCAAWPATLQIAIAGLGEVLFCHATPQSDTEVFTRLTPEDRLAQVFAPVGAPLGVPLVVCGHTHMPFDRTIAGVRVVNAGSVGMPFGAPGAHWLLLEPGVEPRRTDYDLELAADRVRATGYPQAEEFAAKHVLRPPSEEEMLAAFARVEIQ